MFLIFFKEYMLWIFIKRALPMNDLLISSNMFLCWNYNELEHVFEQHYDLNYMVSLKHALSIILKH